MAEMQKKRTVKTGVSDFYVASAEYNAETQKVTYGAPGVFGGTATVGVSVTKNANKIYESDELIHNRSRVSGADITYTSRTVDLVNEMKVMYNLTNEEGEYLVGSDDIPGHWAVGWARKESDGTYTAIWYLWTEPSKDDESDETATETQTSNPESYTFAATTSPERRSDGKTMMKRVKKLTSQEELEAFFASVLPMG